MINNRVLLLSKTHWVKKLVVPGGDTMKIPSKFNMIAYFLASIIASNIFLMGCGNQPQKEKLNFVFILADDLGWNQVGYHGNDFYETPNIDLIAREGMQFSNSYSSAPVCSPTRAGLMTG